MAYFYLLIALAGGLTKGFAGKKISRDVYSLRDGVYINLIRCAFCALIGLAAVLLTQSTGGFTQSGTGWCITAASAIGMAVFSIAWLYVYQSEAYMFLSVVTMLSSICTGLLGAAVYGETISPYKWAGMALLITAVCIMSLYNKKLTGSITRRAVCTLAVGALGTTLADFMQKVYAVETTHSAYTFTFYTYFLPILPQLLLLGILKGEKTTEALGDRRHMTVYAIMALCLYANMLAKALAAPLLSASQMYPLLQGANLVCSAILAQILLKEKASPASILGIVCAMAGVLLMNMR